MPHLALIHQLLDRAGDVLDRDRGIDPVYGTVVSYLRLVFCTPSPMLETSTAPSRRRPIASAAGGLLDPASCAWAGVAMPPKSGAAARPPADNREERRPIVYVRSVLRADAARPLRIEALARELGISVSGFHHHFKGVTAMSPLQFQKQLRLQEARRLMPGEGLDAAGAARRVGYHDAAHFNREYKRLFGAPPMRDVDRLRGTARPVAAPAERPQRAP